jgi:hypothetical protein
MTSESAQHRINASAADSPQGSTPRLRIRHLGSAPARPLDSRWVAAADPVVIVDGLVDVDAARGNHGRTAAREYDVTLPNGPGLTGHGHGHDVGGDR